MGSNMQQSGGRVVALWESVSGSVPISGSQHVVLRQGASRRCVSVWGSGNYSKGAGDTSEVSVRCVRSAWLRVNAKPFEETL